jgi:hypothetical protein
MPFTLNTFCALRPYLYHLTAAANLPRLLRLRRLQSTADLAREAGRDDLLAVRRREHTPLLVGRETVWLRDQAPLHRGNMALEPGWSFERFVAHLNERVFFWPGGATGPISYGKRHYGRYAAEQPVIVRLAVASLVSANPDIALEFSRCNSGSPRYNRGNAGPRGGATFMACSVVQFDPAQVVEVTALGSVFLPDDAKWATSLGGPWTTLEMTRVDTFAPEATAAADNTSC